jgi:DtxR family Mn-dependent transcriptional regulator
MRDQLTHAIEDYLKTIYDLSVTHGRASTTQIAEVLQITPASVTGMIKRLAASQPPLVEYRKHRGVVLTDEGEEIALEIIRHHRLIELFLYETLGYSWDEVDEEADKLEHVISEEFEDKIAHALGDPTHDPHGDPIPTKELKMPTHATLRLSDLRKGQTATVHRVRDTDPELLRYLYSRGLTPGVEVTVEAYSRFDDNLTLRIEDSTERVVLGPKITRQVFVELVNIKQISK